MLYHDHAQSLYTSCSACIGVLRKNTETDILVYGGNWVKCKLKPPNKMTYAHKK